MSGKKGMEIKHYGSVIIDEVIRLKSEGRANSEIVQLIGLKNIKVVKNIILRHNQKQRALAAGILPKKRGRQSKDYPATEEEKDDVIKRLKMENELLRSFRQIAGGR